MDEVQYATWLASLRGLTSSASAAREWREARYRFAYNLGTALVSATADQPALAGPALYGVWLDWGLLYVGQTGEVERRLRDLAIGESHHLANTFPPEIWTRVLVILWPHLPEAEEPIRQYGIKQVGLALEHRLQAWAQPLTNSARRTAAGGWMPVDWGRSGSVGARTAGKIDTLFARIQFIWQTPATQVGLELKAIVRSVGPQALLDGKP